MGRTKEECYNDDELNKLEGHREFKKFHDYMLSYSMPEGGIIKVWQTLMKGLLEQPKMDQEIDRCVRFIQQGSESELEERIQRFIESITCESDYLFYPQVKNVFYNQLSILPIDGKLNLMKNLLRCRNQYYISFVRNVQNYLSIPSDRKLTLWSGGRDLSDFAFELGAKYAPLERTVIGWILDQLPLHYEWSRQAPLWNLLSQAFVAKENYTTAHVFFRTADADSVLLRQEVPLVKAMRGQDFPILWHPVINLQRGAAEATRNELIALAGSGFGSMTEALHAYMDNYKKYTRFNQKSVEHMCIMGLHFNLGSLGPFSNDDDVNWNVVRSYEEKILGG